MYIKATDVAFIGRVADLERSGRRQVLPPLPIHEEPLAVNAGGSFVFGSVPYPCGYFRIFI